ncbi:MAG TPA: translocation/assembly module TamB domain-containing protein [Burkholderiales bacterium]|nr:translocation/assembly module TamB domain-containing protein [Burkholderiales bacterium]
MSKKGIVLLISAGALIAVVLAAGAGGAWLLYTESGLAWVAARLIGVAGKGLTLDGVAGTLAGGASAQQIRFTGKDIELRVREAYLRVAPWSLLVLKPRITELRATELAVLSKPTEPRGRPPDTLVLPADFELPDARVARLAIDLGKGPLDLTDVQLDYSGGRTQHRVHALSLQTFEHAIKMRGAIDAQPPFALNATVSALGLSGPKAELDASVTGTLSLLEIDATAKSGFGRLKGTASIEPYAQFPLAHVKARISGLDLKAVSSALPHTRIEGEFDLSRKGLVLAGPARLTNDASGPYDRGRLPVAALRLAVRTDTRLAHVFELSADLGKAGAVHGTGELHADSARFELTTRNLNLAGLHSRTRQTQLAGRADFHLTRARQSVKADLTERDLRLQFVANRAGDRIEVPQLRAQARGGEAAGSAEIALSGEQPFSVRASFARFNPSAWGNFPAGSINGSANAEGTLAGPKADVRLAIRDSRWFDAPLSAQGTLSVVKDGLRHADVDATVGGNRIVARGALGAPKDVLDVRVDATRLGILDKRLQGALRGNAQLTGNWRAPTVRFSVQASDLAHKNFGAVKAVSADGTVSAHAAGPFDVRASLRDITTAEWQLRSAALRVDGTRAAHSGTLQAQGTGVDLRARARGGWQSGIGWTGTLDELVNSGEAAVSLAAPVSLTLGPQRIQTGSFELRIIGGRLYASGITYQRGKLATAGRFSDVPLRPVLAIAGAPAAMAGTLRLSGQWSLENARGLIGSVTINRESGDVAFGADRSIALGLRTLAVTATFTPEAANVRAEVRSALATATVDGRIMPVRTGADSRYTGASPIAFTAAADIARLAPFAAFIDTAMLLDGEMHARLQASGSLADPLVVGAITGERLAAALPAEGVELKGGTLKASLTQREVRVESFSIRGGEGVFSARGTLARSGFDEASLDWRADNFTALGRPDRRLVVSGKGNAALQRGKLAFTGGLRVQEGLFELSTTTLPTLGNDVVIVGRERAAPAPRGMGPQPADQKRLRAAVDMNVDLGNNVHLRGRGLDVWLSGELRVQSDAQGHLRASGVVDTRRGTFVAYGQRLEIERGRFYFNGPITDPALDILAMRKRQAVEAGVAVTGTMARPVVRVVSNPALPEGEALSWLVLGRPPDQAGTGQLSALPLATAALLGKAGAPIARALNVDEVGVRGGGGAVAQQFLTVGKRLTDRLYIAFEQSLGGTENLLRLEMSLTERIAFRAQAGTNSSVGVFYRYSWD